MANEVATISRKVPAVKTETKKAKFVKLANIRGVATIEALRRLGNLGSGSYEYSEDQIVKLEKAINDAYRAAFIALRARNRKSKTTQSIL